jgi:hypothetical protein
MIKRKNILAENMLRFRSKNIAAQEEAAIRKLIEQQTKMTEMTVRNVDLIDALKGRRLATVIDPNFNLIAFPSTGTPKANDLAILNGQGAILQSGTGPDATSYILLGNIGKLTGGEGNWGIADNSALKVFTYMKSNAQPRLDTAGNRIIPEAPYVTPTTVTDPAVIISTLTKAKYGDGYLLNQNPQRYIADLVSLFSMRKQLTDVAITTAGISKYTKEKLL